MGSVLSLSGSPMKKKFNVIKKIADDDSVFNQVQSIYFVAFAEEIQLDKSLSCRYFTELPPCQFNMMHVFRLTPLPKSVFTECNGGVIFAVDLK